MGSLNRKNDEIYYIMKARTDIKTKERPKALTGEKQFYFEKLESARIDYPKWYPFLLKKYLTRLKDIFPK